MISKPIVALLAATLTVLPAAAQESLSGKGEYLFDDATQLWRATANASALTLDTARNRGYAAFAFTHRGGDYHRVQEGSQTNNFSFTTERYQHLGRWLYGYGSFRFDNGRTNDRAWSDVARTYLSDPFISGSAIAGRYDNQSFDLRARVGTVDFGGWRFGVGLDYRVGDLSRLRDPRSRSELLRYQLTPSLSFTTGRHSVGLSGWYRRYKEKIPNITTVSATSTLVYYQMTGLEAATGTVGGANGYSREYVDHEFGGELTYGYTAENVRSVNALSVATGHESLFEQYKREPGRYVDYTYTFSSQNRFFRPTLIHELDVSVTAREGYADEYRPQLVITIDSLHGYTSQRYDNLFTYRKRYQLRTVDAQLHYRADVTRANAITAYAGLLADVSVARQKHLLPTSRFNTVGWGVTGEYGQSLFGRRLWVEVALGYHWSTKADLQLADATTPYAQSVLLVDQPYFAANYLTDRLALTWQFPLAVKGYRSLWYVGAFVQGVQAQHSLSRTTLGLTLGIFN